MDNRSNCCICGSAMEHICELKNKTEDVINLFAEPTQETGKNIHFFLCPLCGHGQISFDSDSTRYEEFIPSDTFDFAGISGDIFNPLDGCVKEQFAELTSYCNNKKRFMDIGCGTGALLAEAAQSFDRVTGIEPSRTASRIAERRLAAISAKNYQIHNCYFTEGQEYYPVDTFAAIEVFEHINDPINTLICIRQALTDDGVGLIEVPNGDLIIKQGMYTDVYFYHLHYYTPVSLGMLAQKAGFDVVSIKQVDNGVRLSMIVRKSESNESFANRIENEKSALNDAINNYKNVAVWGAGVKARSYISLLNNPEGIKHVFDISEGRVGKYLAGCKVPVETATKKTINECDLIINFASAHNDEVLQRLIREFGYHGYYLYFDKKPMLKNLAND